MSPHPWSLRDATVAVTGGCGFIGSHLVGALARRGARRIVVLDSLRYGRRENLPPGAPIEVVPFDLGFDDPAALGPALSGVDFLFHLAAEKHNQSKDQPLRVLRSNVEGTEALFETACGAGVKKIVLSSSLYAYGRMSGSQMIETETPAPRTVYGISKLAGEHLLAHHGARAGVEHVTLRYFFVYGPRQFAGTGYKSVIVKTFERLLRGEPPLIHGDGLQELDYVYVQDVVEATCRAAELPISGEVLNLGSGVGTSVAELVREMIRVFGASVAPVHGPPDWTAGSRRVGSVEKAAKLLGWRSSTPLGEGLRQTLEWLREGGAPLA